jgi:hypothetical protein
VRVRMRRVRAAQRRAQRRAPAPRRVRRTRAEVKGRGRGRLPVRAVLLVPLAACFHVLAVDSMLGGGSKDHAFMWWYDA